MFDPNEIAGKLKALVSGLLRRPFVTISLLVIVAVVGAAQDELKSFVRSLPQRFASCSTTISLPDAHAAIRAYVPGANSAGLVNSVEKVLCEEGVLTSQNLDGAQLAGLQAKGASFFDVSMVGANLTGANISDARFEGGTLSQANLQQVVAHGTTFIRTRFDDAYWDCGDFEGATFTDIHLRRVSAQSSIMKDVTFNRYGWEQVNLGYADLRGINLFGNGDRYSTIYRANISGLDTRILTSFFNGKLDEVFGPSGACYTSSSPPFDSEFPEWTVGDGARWGEEELVLELCPLEVLERSECLPQEN